MSSPNAVFMPTISALAFKNPTNNWGQVLNDRDLVCNNEIPFDNYYHPLVNENHSYITTKSAAWLQQEIEKGTLGCPTIRPLQDKLFYKQL